MEQYHQHPQQKNYLYQSQLLSPNTSFPSVAGPPNQHSSQQDLNGSTYYLTKNKSFRKQSRAMLINNHQQQSSAKEVVTQNNFDFQPKPTSPNYASINTVSGARKSDEIPEQSATKFKKRHVSTIQDRIHSNTMKNMALIQKQIQANTNMTKNRLAAGQKVSGASLAQLASVRSQTVHTTTRKGGCGAPAGNKTFYSRMTAVGGNRDKLFSNQRDENSVFDDFLKNTAIDSRQGDSVGINFEPLPLGVSGFQHQKAPGTSCEYESTRQTNFFSSAAAPSKFLDMRKKVAGSQLDYTNIGFYEGKSQQSSEMVAGKTAFSKNAISLTTQSQDRQRNLIELSVHKQTDSMTGAEQEIMQTSSLKQKSIDPSPQHPRIEGSVNYKIIQDQDSFLDSAIELNGGNSTSITPGIQNLSQYNSLFAPTELDGKRIVNNISEVQNSRITEESKSQFQSAGPNNKIQMHEVSTILSQSSQLTASKLGRSLECARCRVWKRINQECRNFSQRVNQKDFKSVLKYFEELANIESITKMTPELSRNLLTLKESLRCQYEQEKAELESKIFKLENCLADQQKLTRKYQQDLLAVEKKYEDIHNFIYESRNVTIQSDAKHKAFLKDVTIGKGELEDAIDAQGLAKYSALDLELHDLQDAVDSQRDQHTKTIKMIHDKILNDKRNSAYHFRIEEIFDREAALQNEVTKSFMKEHFKYGKDPAAMCFDKGSITSENMISTKVGYPSAQERKRQDIAQRKLENITHIKIENSLLCQQNTELKQEINDLREYQKEIEAKLTFFQDLDIDQVRKAQDDYKRVIEENSKMRNNMMKSDTHRSTLLQENKRMKLYEEHYRAAVQTSIDFNNDVLKQMKELRKEINCEENDTENLELNITCDKLINTPVDARLSGPAPGSKTINNLFKRHMEEQRSMINESIDILMRTVKIAYSMNRPLLASSQAVEDVFRQQKNAAYADVKVKFDAQLMEQDAAHRSMKEKLEDQIKELTDELKDQTKKNNQANEALRRAKLEKASPAKSPGKQPAPQKSSQSVVLNNQARLPSHGSGDSASEGRETPAAKVKGPPPKKASWPTNISRKSTAKPEKPSALIKRGSNVLRHTSKAQPAIKKTKKKLEYKKVEDVDAEANKQSTIETPVESTIKEETKQSDVVSNITEEMSQDIASSQDEKKAPQQPIISAKKDSIESDSLTESELTNSQLTNTNQEKQSDLPQQIKVKRMSTINAESMQDELGSQRSAKSSFKPIEVHGTAKQASRESLGSSKTPKEISNAALQPAMDYLQHEIEAGPTQVGVHDFKSVHLETHNATRSTNQALQQNVTSEASSEGMILTAINPVLAQQPIEILRNPNAIDANADLQVGQKGSSRNEEQTQVNSKKLAERKKSQQVSTETYGIILTDDPELRAQRMVNLRELTERFKKNPEDPEIKREYFKALKQHYGEPAARNPFAQSFRVSNTSPSPPRKDTQRAQPYSHLSRLQEMVGQESSGAAVERKSVKSKSPSHHQHKLSSILGKNLDLLGSETAKHRFDNRLFLNSKPVQCELLKPTPQTRKFFVDKKVQTDIQLPNQGERKNYKKKQTAKRQSKMSSVTQALDSKVESARSKKYINLQDQTAGYLYPSRIFDQKTPSYSQEDDNSARKVASTMHQNDSEKVLDSGLWVQNSPVTTMPQRRGVEITHRSPTNQSSSMSESVKASNGLNFMFQPVLSSKIAGGSKATEVHKMGADSARSSSQQMLDRANKQRKQQQQKSSAVQTREESVMLEIKTMDMANRKRSFSQLDDTHEQDDQN